MLSVENLFYLSGGKIMLPENSIFTFREPEKQLINSRQSYADGKLISEVIDYEMQTPHNKTTLLLRGLTQEGLEHFVIKYGSTYKTLYLDYCTFIKDFSPLEDLTYLEAIRIEWCKSTKHLWNLSKNTSLKILSIHDSKKLINNPTLLQTSSTLEEIRFWGNFDTKHTLESLDCFEGIKSLKRIDLNNIKLKSHDFSALYTLSNLEEFHFDAGMLTTEEIAWICANFLKLRGDCLRAYTENEASCVHDLRICGYKKPGLYLPEDQARLDKYIIEFDALVEKYKNTN